jgi:hypothetical protein
MLMMFGIMQIGSWFAKEEFLCGKYLMMVNLKIL